MNDLKSTKIPYNCIAKPMNVNLNIQITRKPPRKNPVPFSFPKFFYQKQFFIKGKFKIEPFFKKKPTVPINPTKKYKPKMKQSLKFFYIYEKI